ncbi:hypothetical protein BT63DRAFT_53020 [Microthyrium microscopicum]|uniref:Uncharacterized protein n=1 Tax=Microthyrium microscopicum TaxID=703497 RepID=A0A6A6U3P0_9PEZI|nr:hypothetical protein BT63DRAFT_53020 [Microthyrium microscopicum]
MKTSALLFSALSSLALAAPRPQHGHDAKPAAPSETKVEDIKAEFSSQYKRSRVTYGTYKLSAFNAPAAHGGMSMPGMENEGGMTDASNKKAPKPCSDCTLKYARASLHYPDGTIANFKTGAYLHHLTMAVVGPGRNDVACPGGTMRIPKNMERMLAIHNDRNETYFGINANDKMGFYLGKDDTMDLELMLKNEVNIPKEVIFTIEWEYAPGRPEGWSDVKGIWMDAAPCNAMDSDIPPPKNQTQFTLTGPEWVSPMDGKLLNTVGHMHDGGVDVKILVNGKPVCTSNAEYGSRPEYIASPEAIAQGASKSSHISRYTPCIAIGDIKKGDKLKLTADYDFVKWKPSLNKIGAQSHVMGVAMLFVEVKK